jgi:rhodanese-related sulfurtransferase
MGGQTLPVSPHELYARLGTASAPVLVDVRRQEAFDVADRLIIGAIHRRPEFVPQWLSELPAGRPIVVYGEHEQEVSQDVAATLRGAGIQGAYLEGGIADWQNQRLPTCRKFNPSIGKWITREHPKIDRIACPWLIRRFINPNAEFIYVPAGEVLAVAQSTGATAYDVTGAEFGHVDDRCSFDAIVRHYDINDPALNHLATIVRGADTSRPDLTPQCEGLLAISYGLSANFRDDHEMLGHGMVIYDALYAWCRLQQAAARNHTSGAGA